MNLTLATTPLNELHNFIFTNKRDNYYLIAATRIRYGFGIFSCGEGSQGLHYQLEAKVEAIAGRVVIISLLCTLYNSLILVI